MKKLPIGIQDFGDLFNNNPPKTEHLPKANEMVRDTQIAVGQIEK
jgi:hypothetical protein